MESNLLKINNGIALTVRALCQHMGIEYDSSLVFDELPMVDAVLPAQAMDPKTAATNRVEYQLLNQAVEAEKIQKKMTMGELMTQVSISGMSVYYDAMDQTENLNLALANVSIPISDWWGGSHKIKQQQLKVEKAEVELEEKTEMLALQVEQASNEITESWFQLKITEKSVEQARENLTITADNYHSGILSISDLLEAQALFQSANDTLTEALCGYRIKKARFLQSVNEYN